MSTKKTAGKLKGKKSSASLIVLLQCAGANLIHHEPVPNTQILIPPAAVKEFTK